MDRMEPRRAGGAWRANLPRSFSEPSRRWTPGRRLLTASRGQPRASARTTSSSCSRLDAEHGPVYTGTSRGHALHAVHHQWYCSGALDSRDAKSARQEAVLPPRALLCARGVGWRTARPRARPRSGRRRRSGSRSERAREGARGREMRMWGRRRGQGSALPRSKL